MCWHTKEHSNRKEGQPKAWGQQGKGIKDEDGQQGDAQNGPRLSL